MLSHPEPEQREALPPMRVSRKHDDAVTQPDTDLPVTEVEESPVLSDTIRSSWAFSADKIRADIAHYPADAQEALLALFRWCIDPQHPLRRNEAAARLGCSPNLLYQLLTGCYRSPDKTPRLPSPEFLKRVREFLDLEKKRFEAGQTTFIETPTARTVFNACDLARESQSPVILSGPSHIGKTWAFRYYQASNNHGRTLMCELDAASGLGGMVRKIADSCGISDKSNTSSLIDRIKRALTPNTLLIIDEVHLLHHTYRKQSFFASIEVIRRIYDAAQCGMVLSWTILEDLRNASQGELIQIWRRGVHKIALPVMPTKGDCAAILAASGLDFPKRDLVVSIPAGKETIAEKPYEVVRQLARRDGLKAITERLRYARKLANRASQKMTWSHFIDAHLTIEHQSQPAGEWH